METITKITDTTTDVAAAISEHAEEASTFLSSLWATIAEYATKFGVRLIAAILILIIGSKLIKLTERAIGRGKAFAKMTKTAQNLLKDIVKVVLYLVLIITIATLLGVSMTSLIALLTSAGLAVGLALQGSLANLAGGFMILLFKPFEVGDRISDGTHDGVVKDIGVFYTIMDTFDNVRITIPNGALSNSAIVDYSTHDTRRVDMTFSVGYNSDIKLVTDTLTALMNAHELVLKDPAPFVRLSQHGDSALVFTARAWAKSEDYWTVYYDLTEAAKTIFDKRGIEIPFPQVDVHIKEK